MSGCSLGVKRFLAIDPTSKGFGFAVLEGPDTLVDWGVKHATGNRECLQQAVALIGRYQPEVLVVERTDAAGCLRRLRARQLIGDLLALARERELRARRISRQTVLRYFVKSGFATKRQIAVALSIRFPELEPYLPPERKPWMSEDERMGIFDAVAFGLAALGQPHAQDSEIATLSPATPLIHAQ
jgi:hypothetical protein